MWLLIFWGWTSHLILLFSTKKNANYHSQPQTLDSNFLAIPSTYFSWGSGSKTEWNAQKQLVHCAVDVTAQVVPSWFSTLKRKIKSALSIKYQQEVDWDDDVQWCELFLLRVHYSYGRGGGGYAKFYMTWGLNPRQSWLNILIWEKGDWPLYMADGGGIIRRGAVKPAQKEIRDRNYIKLFACHHYPFSGFDLQCQSFQSADHLMHNAQVSVTSWW